MSLIFFFVLCFGAAAVGSVFTAASVKSWYSTIRKPAWNPPDKVFAPVWTILYLMMAVAGWMAWERLPGNILCLPMMLFVVQLILNAGWSALFFGLRKPGWAFMELMLLWVSILLTMTSFWNIYWLAGLLFLPYFLWVSFAGVLNFHLWKLNRS
ncbi:MAG: TspO/MBR family protein [Candidatus Omnitrophota bacterium]